MWKWTLSISIGLIVLGTVSAADAPAPAPSGPPVTITLGGRHGHVEPHREGCTHTGGGNIDVAQPSPDTVVITMSGIAVATAMPCKCSTAALHFDLDQCLEVVAADPKVKKVTLTLEGRVIGLLRSHCKGSAEQGESCVSIGCGPIEVLSLCVPPHSVCGGENLSVNCKEKTHTVPIAPGEYTLHQTFAIRAAHPKCLAPCKAASAEFAPDPALDPLWISYWEPFHGAAKKDFGFQVTVKVAADDSNGKEKEPEKAPAPKPDM